MLIEKFGSLLTFSRWTHAERTLRTTSVLFMLICNGNEVWSPRLLEKCATLVMFLVNQASSNVAADHIVNCPCIGPFRKRHIRMLSRRFCSSHVQILRDSSARKGPGISSCSLNKPVMRHSIAVTNTDTNTLDFLHGLNSWLRYNDCARSRLVMSGNQRLLFIKTLADAQYRLGMH